MDAHLIKNVISNTDLTILKRIHSTNRSQDNLKKTLIKFDLGSSAVINPDFSFNIWCRPQTDGAGDFSLINKIAKELKSYGIPNRSINFAIGVTKFSTFLRELSEFVRKVDELNIIVQEATAKMEEVNPHMQNILRGLTLLRFTRDNTNNQQNIIKNINYNIPRDIQQQIQGLNGIFDKNKNYRLLEDIQLLLNRLKETKYKKARNNIKANLEGELYGTFIPFVFSRIINEFPDSNLYIFDRDNFNLDGNRIQGLEMNDLYSQIMANCRFDTQTERTINLQLLPSIPMLNSVRIFNSCNKNRVFYLNEGGIYLSNYPDFHIMGVGEKSLGIFKANTYLSRDELLGYLNDRDNKFIADGETPVETYHVVYVGQTLLYEIDKNMEGKKYGESDYKHDEHGYGIINLQRVFLFLKLLKQKYSQTQNQTIHVFILDVFKKILEIFNSGLASVFPEYNSEDNTFRVNPTTVLKIKFFKRIEQSRFVAFIKHSEPILYTTGDQSYQEALSLGKLVFHDYVDHRMQMVNNLLTCYNDVTGIQNNYKKFLDTHLKRVSDAAEILYSSFETAIREFFGNDRMLTSLYSTLEDYFKQDANSTKFYNFFMKHYDFSKEFKKIIFLMQNNVLDNAINEEILISREFESEFTKVDLASYKKKYLKYKEKYLKLKEKLKGGAINFRDKEDGTAQLVGLNEERSKHSPIFTNKQKIITNELFKYLNEKVKFKLSINYLGGPKIVLGNHLIKDLNSGRVLGRGANGIAMEFDNNIVIKVSKMMETNPTIIENEVQNMIDLYRRGDRYNFRDDQLVKLLGVVYMNGDYNIIKNFDNTRTHYTEEFNVDLGEGITQNDRIGFVIMEKYDGSLDSLNLSILNRSQKYDIAVQILLQMITLFNKGYFHTDLHDGNWFYKIENGKYIIRIADYGSEIRDGYRIGVIRLSDDAATSNIEKNNSLKSALITFVNKQLITQEQFYSILDINNYNQLLSRLREILNTNYPPTSEDDRLNQGILLSLV
jgi:hypothetical protein